MLMDTKNNLTSPTLTLILAMLFTFTIHLWRISTNARVRH